MVLALFACLPKPTPVRAETPLPIEVVAVLGGIERGVVAAPESVYDALEAVLQERNAVPTIVPPERFVGLFGSKRDTERRIEALAPAGLLLLTEAEVAFYSQMSGRYRWTVSVELTLAPTGLSDSFEVPVFLEHDREREPAALIAASPVIARHVGELLDAYLGGRSSD